MKGLYDKYKITIINWRDEHKEEFKDYMHNYYLMHRESKKEDKNKKQSAHKRYKLEAQKFRNILL
jgi:hypothetical protein